MYARARAADMVPRRGAALRRPTTQTRPAPDTLERGVAGGAAARARCSDPRPRLFDLAYALAFAPAHARRPTSSTPSRARTASSPGTTTCGPPRRPRSATGTSRSPSSRTTSPRCQASGSTAPPHDHAWIPQAACISTPSSRRGIDHQYTVTSRPRRRLRPQSPRAPPVHGGAPRRRCHRVEADSDARRAGPRAGPALCVRFG